MSHLRVTSAGLLARVSGKCVMGTNAGAAKMAGAWFIHGPVWLVRPVRDLYRPHFTDGLKHFNYFTIRYDTLRHVVPSVILRGFKN